MHRRFTAILMSGAIVSKVLAFAREVLMAQVIGASLVADSFRGAVTAVIMPLTFLQSEGVPAILIPMHREWQANGDAPQRLAAFAVAFTSLSFGLMLLLQAIGGWWIDALVGGFAAEGRTLALEFVRIMALGMPGSTLLNCLAAGEIALGRTRLTNARTCGLNVALIIGIVTAGVTGHVSALAWAFAAAFNALGLWAFWALWRERHISFAGLTFSKVVAEGTEFLRRLFPLLAIPAADQCNVWIERLLASRLVTGAVASIDYARTFTEATLPLIAQPVGLAVLASHPPKDARTQIEAIARPILALALPASVFLFIFAPDIVREVYFRGAFTETGVVLTSQMLRGISVGLWAATLGWILLRVLNASGRNVRAAAILVVAYAVNMAFNLTTSWVHPAGDTSILLLGLGETARGFVLLFGVVLALECRAHLFRLILVATIPAALMALVSWEIHQTFTATLPRLLMGAVSYGVCTAIAIAMLMPSVRQTALTFVQSLLARARRA